jgi:Tfp pilus assembly protein PilX
MKSLFRTRDGASKGAALMIVLAFVVLLAGVALAYFTRTTTDRQIAQSSYNDTSADLFARSALNIVVGSLKQEILTGGTTVTATNIQPQRSGADAAIPNLIRRSIRNDPIVSPGVSSLASAISSGPADPTNVKRGEIKSSRWNSHYLIPRLNTGTQIDSTPLSNFVAPDWVLITRNGPSAFSGWDNSLKDQTNANYVVGRYAFAVYDEGGLLDMSLAGFPGWTGNPGGSCNPAPTPWLNNVGYKGTVGLADLTALGTYAPPQTQIDNIVGWRNYATTLRTGAGFGSFSYTADPCATQDSYGSYLLDFGDPPFTFDVTNQPVPISSYPFSTVYPTINSARTDQAFITRQQLLKLRSSLGFSQNVLQYMGTFSRERNRPAPDWPFLQNNLSEGRYCFDNLDLVKPNPDGCTNNGRHKGQGKGKGRGHLCGTQADIVNLFGLLWVPSTAVPPDPNGNPQPGHWRYIAHNGPTHDPNPNAIDHVPPFRGPNHQNDFFQILDYALFRVDYGVNGDADPIHLSKTFAIGASLIDQYDSDADDLDLTLTGTNKKWQTHTTVIEYTHNGGSVFAYGMETSDVNYTAGGNNPHRPLGAPTPGPNTYVMNHAFTNTGQFGYGIFTNVAGVPTVDLSTATSSDAPVVDFFTYNPVSSLYPRAGIINLNTKNAPALAAIIKGAAPTDGASTFVGQTAATNAASAIVGETTARPALTRGDIARLASVAGGQIGASQEQQETIARALAELGQTRTWNLLIDVVAQTGHYRPNAQGLPDFIPEGEKRYWLHAALGRDLVRVDGTTPCQPGDTGCQVDVLGTQLEEVVE